MTCTQTTRWLKTLRKIPSQLVGALLFAVIVFFLVLYLKDTDFHQLRHLRVGWWLIGLGSLVGLGFRYWMVLIWRVILRALGSGALPPYRIMAHVYSKAWLARYIPGTVTWIAGKVVMAASYGISKSRLGVSSLLEAGVQITASVTVSLVLIGFSSHLQAVPMALRVIIVLISLACLGVLFPPVFNRLLYVAHVAIKKQRPSEELTINGRALIRSFCLFVVGTFINGTASFFIVQALAPHVGFGLYFYTVGIFGLSGAAGMATPFLPSGIGVRDGLLLLLLAAVIPKDIALAITVFSRLWQVAVDVIFWALAAAYDRFHDALQGVESGAAQ